MMKNVSDKLQEIFTTSLSYRKFEYLIRTGFKDELAFREWVYKDEVDVFDYIGSIDSKDSVKGVCEVIEDVFIQNNMKFELDAIKKDKEAYKFIYSWMKRSGRDSLSLDSFSKLSSGKRNLYSLFICVLMRFPNTDSTIKK